jgi:hypothetical protein
MSRRGFEESGMTRKGFHQPIALACAAAILASGLALVTSAADAAERAVRRPAHRAAVRQDYSRHVEHTRTEDGRTRSDVWVGEDGRAVSRDAVVRNDREAGLRTRDVVVTGPEGAQVTRSDVTQRTDDGYTRDSVVTLPDGRTATRSAAVTRDAETGTRTRQAATTGPNGQTRTLDDVTQRTDDGFTRSTVITNPDGSTVTREIEAASDPETGTWSKDVNVDRE